jgi:sugar lactone lactonase YvrE
MDTMTFRGIAAALALSSLALAACAPSPPPEPRLVRDFSAAAYEFPESVALHGGSAYVTFALDGRVVRVAADGTQTDFGRVPIPAPMSAFALGIAIDGSGAAFVALVKADPTGPAVPGVYRIAPTGGDATLFASHPALFAPNDLDFDAAGNLYVTDGVGGAVYRVGPAGGEAVVWADHALLDPAPTADGPCGPRTAPFPIGANGIAIEPGRVVVNNTETASIVAIPVLADGSAGVPSVVATSCEVLAGTDGLARDDGSWLTTVQSTNALVRVEDDGTLVELHRAGLFRSPAAVDVGTFGDRRSAVIASSAFAELFSGMPAMPALVALDL